MKRRVFPGWTVVFLAGACLSLCPSAGAEEWEATADGLGRDTARFALRAGLSYGLMKGSELENMDPSSGFDIVGSWRAFGVVSVVGSYAVDKANVDGQVVQLLDQKVRPDGRSGTVEGEVETSRFRVGARVDAWRERGWRFQPYVLGAVVFSTIDVTIDTVDGAAPLPVPTSPGQPEVDVSSFSDDQIGGLARVGVEFRITPNVAADLTGNFEVIEAELGTNSIFALNSGLVVRF